MAFAPIFLAFTLINSVYADCPATKPQINTACPTANLQCTYDPVCCTDGPCQNTSVLTCGSNLLWSENDLSIVCTPVCPPTKPAINSACSYPNLNCPYDLSCCPFNGPCYNATNSVCSGTLPNAVWEEFEAEFVCPPPPTPQFLGCFVDNSSRDLPIPISLTSAVATTCQAACSSTRYFGLQDGGQCWCGNTFGKYGLSPSGCNMQCSGGSGICGGSWANSVYSDADIHIRWKNIDLFNAFALIYDNTAPWASNPYVNVVTIGGNNWVQLNAGVYTVTYLWVENDSNDQPHIHLSVTGTNGPVVDASAPRLATLGQATWSWGPGIVTLSTAQPTFAIYGPTLITITFDNNYYTYGTAAIIALRAAPPIAPQYLGCFTDTSTRDLSTNTNQGSATITTCATACSGFRYFGLQYGGQCFCGNTFGTHGLSSQCTMPCNANTAQTCGGTWANSIYAKVYPEVHIRWKNTLQYSAFALVYDNTAPLPSNNYVSVVTIGGKNWIQLNPGVYTVTYLWVENDSNDQPHIRLSVTGTTAPAVYANATDLADLGQATWSWGPGIVTLSTPKPTFTLTNPTLVTITFDNNYYTYGTAAILGLSVVHS